MSCDTDDGTCCYVRLSVVCVTSRPLVVVSGRDLGHCGVCVCGLTGRRFARDVSTAQRGRSHTVTCERRESSFTQSCTQIHLSPLEASVRTPIRLSSPLSLYLYGLIDIVYTAWYKPAPAIRAEPSTQQRNGSPHSPQPPLFDIQTTSYRRHAKQKPSTTQPTNRPNQHHHRR